MTPTPPPAPAASCLSCASSRSPIGELAWGGGPMFSKAFREVSGLRELIWDWRDVAAHELSAAARSLLVHRMSMTSRLEQSTGGSIDLSVLYAERHEEVDSLNVVKDKDSVYERMVLLRRHSDGVPLELGFLAVQPGALPVSVRQLLRESHEPFGALLSRYLQSYESSPLIVSPDRFGTLGTDLVARLVADRHHSIYPARADEPSRAAADRRPARITVLSLDRSALPPAEVEEVADSTNVSTGAPLPIATALEVLLPGVLGEVPK